MLGLSQERAAARLGVDSGTLARWERGERRPVGRFLEMVERFLESVETKDSELRAG